MAQKETSGKPRLSYLTHTFACLLADSILFALTEKRNEHTNIDVAIQEVLLFSETGAGENHLREAAANVCLCFPRNPKESPHRFGIIPEEALKTHAEVREFGAKKYARNNWKKGIPFSFTLDAILRHLFAFARGQETDPESGISHLGHVLCDIEHILALDSALKISCDDR
jgi:Domain of unknown function (DUF5664)